MGPGGQSSGLWSIASRGIMGPLSLPCFLCFVAIRWSTHSLPHTLPHPWGTSAPPETQRSTWSWTGNFRTTIQNKPCLFISNYLYKLITILLLNVSLTTNTQSKNCPHFLKIPKPEQTILLWTPANNWTQPKSYKMHLLIFKAQHWNVNKILILFYIFRHVK